MAPHLCVETCEKKKWWNSVTDSVPQKDEGKNALFLADVINIQMLGKLRIKGSEGQDERKK